MPTVTVAPTVSQHDVEQYIPDSPATSSNDIEQSTPASSTGAADNVEQFIPASPGQSDTHVIPPQDSNIPEEPAATHTLVDGPRRSGRSAVTKRKYEPETGLWV